MSLSAVIYCVAGEFLRIFLFLAAKLPSFLQTIPLLSFLELITVSKYFDLKKTGGYFLALFQLLEEKKIKSGEIDISEYVKKYQDFLFLIKNSQLLLGCESQEFINRISSQLELSENQAIINCNLQEDIKLRYWKLKILELDLNECQEDIQVLKKEINKLELNISPIIRSNFLLLSNYWLTPTKIYLSLNEIINVLSNIKNNKSPGPEALNIFCNFSLKESGNGSALS